MLGLDRRTLHVAWTLFLFVAVIAVVYAVRSTLVVFALALFFAQLLSPVVEFVSRSVPARISRTAALGIVYILLIGALTAIVIPLSGRIADEAANLATRLPAAIGQDPLSRLPIPSWLEPFRPRLTELVRQRIQELDQDVLPLLTKAGTQILTGIGSLLSVILIPILSFFFLKDGQAMREAIIESFPAAQHHLVSDIFKDLHLLLAGYMRALALLSVATFLAYTAYLGVTGVPYPVLLGGIAAALEFIPVVGPLIASVTIVLVALFSNYAHVAWIVVFLIVYRIFQDYVLNPHLMSSSAEIHPLLVLFGVLAGEQLAGIPGMFFSVPVIAGLRLIVVRLRRRHVV